MQGFAGFALLGVTHARMHAIITIATVVIRGPVWDTPPCLMPSEVAARGWTIPKAGAEANPVLPSLRRLSHFHANRTAHKRNSCSYFSLGISQISGTSNSHPHKICSTTAFS